MHYWRALGSEIHRLGPKVQQKSGFLAANKYTELNKLNSPFCFYNFNSF